MLGTLKQNEEELQRTQKNLRQDIRQRVKVEKEIRDLNDNLETIVQDRTKALEEEKEKAEASNRAKSAFLANMSHELRTPLNAILGFSTLMTQSSDIPETEKDNLKIINHSGEHLLQLVNDVLDMSKIEAGHVRLDAEDFDLGELIRNITDMMRIRASEKGLQLLVDQTSKFPRIIHGDAPKLRQILINLLSNAIKFTNQAASPSDSTRWKTTTAISCSSLKSKTVAPASNKKTSNASSCRLNSSPMPPRKKVPGLVWRLRASSSI